jgi:predicted aspartyl protease
MFSPITRRLPLLVLVISLHLTRFGCIDASAHANVSLRMLNGNLPVACVSINGRAPVEFVIDTGTNTTLIDPAMAIRLGLNPVGTKRLTTLSGPTDARRYVLDTVAIASASQSHVEALAQPMTQLQRLDANIQGIIGLDFLRAFSFRIDYRLSRLELYAADELPDITGGVRVSLRIVDDHILVPVVSGDAVQGTWRLALDSGISRLLVFKNRLAVRSESPGLPRSNFLGAAPGPFGVPGTTRVATNLSNTIATAIILDEIAIGDLSLANIPALVLPAAPAALDASEDGLLPACIFHAVFVDYPNSTVTFDPD